MIEDITISFYQNICRGLFEEHKLLYSFLNAIRINLDKLKLRPLEWAFLLSGLEGREGDPFNKDGLKFDGKV